MALLQMAHRIFLTVYLLLNLGCLSWAQPQWDQTELTVKQGDKVTVRCSADLGGDPFGVLQVIRKLPAAENGVDEVTILENDNIKAPFSNSPRYAVEFNMDDTIANVELTFEGIRGEDGGRLGCLSIDNMNEVAYMTINVQVPVSEVYMVRIQDGQDMRAGIGETIHLRQNEPLGVGCVVSVDGSQDAPQVVLEVAGQDETSLFTPLLNPVRIKSADGGPDIHSTTAKYTYVTATPSADFNQRNLTCRASTEGFPPTVAWAFVDVKYEPLVTCPKYEHFAKQGESVTIECTLRANPGATLSWSFGSEGDMLTPVDISDPEQGISTQEEPFDEDKTKISIMIRSVGPSHFTRYYVTAENDLGSSQTFVVLREGAETAPPVDNPDNPPSDGISGPQVNPVSDGNGASTSSIAYSLGLLCVLFALLQH